MKLEGTDYIIENYARRKPFASFLPGIAGKWGIPVWCYTVNRGQAVASFGVADKDHAILEFSPAHQSYRQTPLTGFRTFLRWDSAAGGGFHEPFQDPELPHTMGIGRNDLTLTEDCPEQGWRVVVRYFVLPGEPVGALAREVAITNTGKGSRTLELLDGLPEWIPYGVSLDSIKGMCQTAKAWMLVEDVEKNLPWARVRASMEDSARVRAVTGGSFAAAIDGEGRRLPALVDSDAVFGWDSSLRRPLGFLEAGTGLLDGPQVTQNRLPCCFFAQTATIGPGQSVRLLAVYGQAERKAAAEAVAQGLTPATFDRKGREARALADKLCAGIRTRTADPVFDAYCGQTLLDNILRGGHPVPLGDKVFHLYSRKHGDLERDYNFFRMLPEYYSQGNGNFRDVNQNRRCDVFFEPRAGLGNIRDFYDLIQLDGYNPLVVEQTAYRLPEESLVLLLELVGEAGRVPCAALLARPFTPGRFAMAAETWPLTPGVTRQSLLEKAVTLAEPCLSASFGEGYWTDHWTYNLDLVESYLAVYPEREAALLFDERVYRYYETRALVNPRRGRYVAAESGVRQYRALDHEAKAGVGHDWARESFGAGGEARSTLMEKLLLLCALKLATLDPFGMGVEMEGGKPGWYDALNGLPGLLGSSVAETCELARLIRFCEEQMERHGRDVEVYAEIAGLIREVTLAAEEFRADLLREPDATPFWHEVNERKEAYRAQTLYGVSGKRETLSAGELLRSLELWGEIAEAGVAKAEKQSGGVPPTYFYYEVEDFREDADGLLPIRFRLREMPLFLEGPVRRMKLPMTREARQSLHRRVRASNLYDQKLRMFKVNASLADTSLEVGRARSFTPGWLENESIWLHMEYKYLLELLKSGLYEEFCGCFRDAAAPFLEPETYGRSPLENVSFIASSANPDPGVHGQGFVARLSGSTAEFLQIWLLMMFGERPFFLEEGRLAFRIRPCIPDYLLPTDGVVEATLLGQIPVRLETSRPRLIPGEFQIREYRLLDETGETRIPGDVVHGEAARRIREREIAAITVVFDE